MALGKYTRVDNKRSSSSYCSTVTIAVIVSLCLVGVWMMISSYVVPVQNVDAPQEKINEVNEQIPVKINDGNDEVTGNKATDNKETSNTVQFEDIPGDLPVDAIKGDSSDSSSQENQDENLESRTQQIERLGDETKSDDGERKSESGEMKNEGGVNDTTGLTEPGEASKEKKSVSSDSEKANSDESENNTEQNESKIEENVDKSDSNELSIDSDEKNHQSMLKDQNQIELLPSGAQLELLKETTTQNGAFSTQAAESRSEKASQESTMQETGFSWKLCNITAGPDYIPCLDNLQAIRSLRSTKHYEHRERHCPEKPPTCLVPLPEGYKRPIGWPKSREKIWYYNVPHTKLAEVKGHQNWVKVTGEYLTFPGGGTQFKHGALHYIDFIQESIPDIGWGKQSRVILDVGCGVASFGGSLFDRGVLAMSFAPKDEHEAQVQFALERGIPAISAVMGTTRLPFPGCVFDVVHCARCRVPWHIEGGKLLLELNRVLRPGGFFVWSATPVYQKLAEDVEIWNAMSELTKAMCWELISVNKDTVNRVGVVTYRKPTTNECYEKRSQAEPPLCADSDDSDAAWNVPLQACMHKVPTGSEVRGSQWPEQWPARLDKAPYWLLNSQVGVYGKPAPEDFTSDYEHWKRVVSKSYLTGIGIDWSTVRNVMDMRSVYGGFAACPEGFEHLGHECGRC